MKKPALGLLTGVVLGFLDGLSAMFDPDVRSMITFIIVGATIKGALTGAIVGLMARRLAGVPRNIAFGLSVGAILSFVVAVPTGTYLPIIAPGVAIGALIGWVVSRWGASSPAAGN